MLFVILLIFRIFSRLISYIYLTELFYATLSTDAHPWRGIRVAAWWQTDRQIDTKLYILLTVHLVTNPWK